MVDKAQTHTLDSQLRPSDGSRRAGGAGRGCRRNITQSSPHPRGIVASQRTLSRVLHPPCTMTAMTLTPTYRFSLCYFFSPPQDR